MMRLRHLTERNHIFKITGPSKPEDTLKPDINADLTGMFFPCINDTASIEIRNDGNVNLVLQSITLQADSIEANFSDSLLLPKIIPPDSILKLSINVLPYRNRTGRIKISSIFN